jgi:hypothetical protein
MRRLALVPALALAVLIAGSATASGKTAFTGDWVGNDPAPPVGDGSRLHLNISGGTHANIKFTDDFGTVCVHAGASDTVFRSTLTGTVYDGDVMVATFRSAHCGNVPIKFLHGETVIYELDDQGNNNPADDTFFDGSVTWFRA